ncbi:MAG: amidase family protein, partial [Acidimicrobiia bacterium]
MDGPEVQPALLDVRDALARGDTSAGAVVATQCDRLSSVAESTNCVAWWNDAGALAQAMSLDRRHEDAGPVGSLHGVPITVKDWIDVAELPCTGGFVEDRDRVAERDASVVGRLRAAGAIVIAKTTVQVDSALFGPVRHPHDPTRSPGGSSSGEAAAVGGGGSMLGLASDSGGSIRVPAGWCGAAALKPSAGLVPTTGHFPRVGERSDGRTQIGAMAGSVAALAAVLPVMAGPDGLDGGVAPVPLGDPSQVELAGLQVGWWV